MNTKYYKVCYVRLGAQSSSGMASCGLLFYVYHITRETDSPDLLDFINQSILKSVHGKNGADCYSKNGHAVTVLTVQS